MLGSVIRFWCQILRNIHTIFALLILRDKALWSDGEMAKDKVLTSRWMRQFAHTWRHFSFWRVQCLLGGGLSFVCINFTQSHTSSHTRPPHRVPWARFIQGTRHTWYCGSYTLFNTQEIAVMSGLAVAERLGAEYPFGHDRLAAAQFDMFLGMAHRRSRKSKR